MFVLGGLAFFAVGFPANQYDELAYEQSLWGIDPMCRY